MVIAKDKIQKKLTKLLQRVSTQRLASLRIYGLGIILAMTAYFTLAGFLSYGFDFSKYDWMLISGLLVFWFGLSRYTLNPDIFKNTISELQNRRAIEFKSEALSWDNDLLISMLKKSDLPIILSLFSGILISIAFLNAFLEGYSLSAFNILLMLFEICGGLLSGYCLGKIASQGFVLNKLENLGFTVNIIPNHPDKTGGWSPYADLLLHQSPVSVLPIIYVSTWAFIINATSKFDRYDHWGAVYAVLPFGALVYLFFSSLVPLFLFYRLARRERQLVLSSEYSELAENLSILETETKKARTTGNWDKYLELLSSQDVVKSRMESLQKMPLLLLPIRARRTWALVFAPISALASIVGIISPFQSA